MYNPFKEADIVATTFQSVLINTSIELELHANFREQYKVSIMRASSAGKVIIATCRERQCIKQAVLECVKS